MKTRLVHEKYTKRTSPLSCFFVSFVDLPAAPGIDEHALEQDQATPNNERGSFWVSKVTLHPEIAWGGGKAPTAAELDQLHHRSHEQCFIANSVKTEVVVGAPPS